MSNNVNSLIASITKYLVKPTEKELMIVLRFIYALTELPY